MARSLLSALLGSDDDLPVRIKILERHVKTIMEALGIEDPPNPREPEIQALIDEDKKIQAIKIVRELSGCGLAEAKQAVDHGSWKSLIRAHA